MSMPTLAHIRQWPPRTIRRVALGVGAFQTALVGFIVASSGYIKDDFLFFAIGRSDGLGEKDLTLSVLGSLVPGFQLGNAAVGSTHPIQRWPAVAITVILYALALFLFYRLCELLVGPRPLIVPLMAVAGLSGVLAVSLVWWTAALNSLPAAVCDLLALYALVLQGVTGKSRYLVVSIVSFAVGVAFYDASSSFLAVLVVFTVLYLMDDLHWRAVLAGLARRWWLWAAYFIPIVFNLTWRSLHSGAYVLGPSPGAGDVLRFIGTGWSQGFVPSTFGVTFSNVHQTALRVLVVAVGQVLFFGIVATTIRRRREAWRAWTLFAAGFAAIEILAAVGRAGDGTLFASNTVYWTAQPFLLSLALVLALVPSRLPLANPVPAATKDIGMRFGARVVAFPLAAVAAVCVLGAYAMWSTPDRTRGAQVSGYLQTLSRSWQEVSQHDPQAFVWDTTVPSFVLDPFYAPYNRIAQSAGLMVDLRIDATQGTGYVVSSNGSLIPAHRTVVSTAHLTGGPSGPCVSRQAHSQVARIALNTTVPTGNWFLRLHYAQSSGFSASFYGERLHFSKGQGGILTPDGASNGKSSFSLTIPAGESLCVTSADIEAPAAHLQFGG
jgi:hypothetical protein